MLPKLSPLIKFERKSIGFAPFFCTGQGPAYSPYRLAGMELHCSDCFLNAVRQGTS